MIDKLDLRIPRKTPFTPSFQRVYPQLQAMERGLFRTGKYYEYAGDLREYGYSVRLNLYCRMEKDGNHKLELIDAGTMSRSAMVREITGIFDVDPRTLTVMRVDFAVNVPNVSLEWFRETVRVDHKRFRSALTGDRFYVEMGSGTFQTLYFGKRPNLIRIYDKMAEYRHQYRNLLRGCREGEEAPTFAQAFGLPNADVTLTRVERQLGGRVPVEVATFGNVCADDFQYKPFANLKIIDHAMLLERDGDDSFETYCTGMHLRSIAKNDGMQAVQTFLSRHSKGNVGWAWKKYSRFLPSAEDNVGLTTTELQCRFATSLARQMQHS